MAAGKILATILLTIVVKTVIGTYQDFSRIAEPNFFFYPSQDGSDTLVQAFVEPPVNESHQGIKEVDPDDIHFYLYTPSNPRRPDELFPGNAKSLKNSNFVKNAPVKVLCHGFSSSYDMPFPAKTRAKYLALQGPINVIVIDWSILAVSPYYFTASLNAYLVGKRTADLINFLVQAGVAELEEFHLVGHSLGAHAMGVTGRKIGKGRIGRVTGLDPASPLWENNPSRISHEVAQFVDIIHSNAMALGIRKPLGLADFYPNGGDLQVGCGLDPFGACSHDRSYDYFTESIVGPSETPKFSACRCNNCQVNDESQAACMHDHYSLGACECEPRVYMGDSAPVWLRARGSYYVVTNSKSPYSKASE